MTPLLVLLVTGALVGYLTAFVLELRRDGYGTRPGPRSHPEQSPRHALASPVQRLHEGS